MTERKGQSPGSGRRSSSTTRQGTADAAGRGGEAAEEEGEVKQRGRLRHSLHLLTLLHTVVCHPTVSVITWAFLGNKTGVQFSTDACLIDVLTPFVALPIEIYNIDQVIQSSSSVLHLTPGLLQSGLSWIPLMDFTGLLQVFNYRQGMLVSVNFHHRLNAGMFFFFFCRESKRSWREQERVKLTWRYCKRHLLLSYSWPAAFTHLLIMGLFFNVNIKTLAFCYCLY